MVKTTLACFKRNAAGAASTQQAKQFEDEKKLIFAIAKCPLDNGNPLHYNVLLTIFKKLTGDTVDRPR